MRRDTGFEETRDRTRTSVGRESRKRERFRRKKKELTYRRGLVGMANSGKRNTNTSQFFFTLDKADELTNKHTMFGKVVGNTIYSMSSFPIYVNTPRKKKGSDDRFDGSHTIGCR